MTPFDWFVVTAATVAAAVVIALFFASLQPSVARAITAETSTWPEQWQDLVADVRSWWNRAGRHESGVTLTPIRELTAAPVIAMRTGEPATPVTDEHVGATEDWSPRAEIQEVSVRRTVADVRPATPTLDEEAQKIVDRLAAISDSAANWIDEDWLSFLDRVDEGLSAVDSRVAEAHRRWRAGAIHFDTAEYRILTAA